jgi:hypothetical protein
MADECNSDVPGNLLSRADLIQVGIVALGRRAQLAAWGRLVAKADLSRRRFAAESGVSREI